MMGNQLIVCSMDLTVPVLYVVVEELCYRWSTFCGDHLETSMDLNTIGTITGTGLALNVEGVGKVRESKVG